MNFKHLIWIAIPALIAGALVQARLHQETAWSGPDPVLTDNYGESRRFSDYGENLLIVNFWAAWCEPCREEIPRLNQLHEQWGSKNVAVIGIALDTPEASQEFLRQQPVAYPILRGQMAEKLMSTYGNTSGNLPFTIVLDARGRTIFRHIGPVDFIKLEDTLSKALPPA